MFHIYVLIKFDYIQYSFIHSCNLAHISDFDLLSTIEQYHPDQYLDIINDMKIY